MLITDKMIVAAKQCVCGAMPATRIKEGVDHLIHWVDCVQCGRQGEMCLSRQKALKKWNMWIEYGV